MEMLSSDYATRFLIFSIVVVILVGMVEACLAIWRRPPRVIRVPAIPTGAKGVFILYYTDDVFDCIGVDDQRDFRTAIPEEVEEKTTTILYVTKNDVILYRTHNHSFREPVVLCP